MQAFAAACDALIETRSRDGPLEDDAVPQLRGGEAAFTILEHELMHQETLLYMLHDLPYDEEVGDRAGRRSARWTPATVARTWSRSPPAAPRSARAAASASAGTTSFRRMSVDVPAFTIDVHNVTNGAVSRVHDAPRARRRRTSGSATGRSGTGAGCSS